MQDHSGTLDAEQVSQLAAVLMDGTVMSDSQTAAMFAEVCISTTHHVPWTAVYLCMVGANTCDYCVDGQRQHRKCRRGRFLRLVGG